jgi:hypothetical protein
VGYGGPASRRCCCGGPPRSICSRERSRRGHRVVQHHPYSLLALWVVSSYARSVNMGSGGTAPGASRPEAPHALRAQHVRTAPRPVLRVPGTVRSNQHQSSRIRYVHSARCSSRISCDPAGPGSLLVRCAKTTAAELQGGIGGTGGGRFAISARERSQRQRCTRLIMRPQRAHGLFCALSLMRLNGRKQRAFRSMCIRWLHQGPMLEAAL